MCDSEHGYDDHEDDVVRECVCVFSVYVRNSLQLEASRNNNSHSGHFASQQSQQPRTTSRAVGSVNIAATTHISGTPQPHIALKNSTTQAPHTAATHKHHTQQLGQEKTLKRKKSQTAEAKRVRAYRAMKKQQELLASFEAPGRDCDRD